MELYIYITIVFLFIVLSQVIEVYAYLLKGAITSNKGRQLIGLANWVQYFARILYMLVLMILSFMFEVLGYVEYILPVISFSFFISFLLSLLLVKSSIFRGAVQLILVPLTNFVYPELVKINFKFENKSLNFDAVFLFSLFSSFMIGLAFVVPFVIAFEYPDFRMMATYSGQLLNFFATAVIFSIVEPRMYKQLDGEISESSNVYIICDKGVSIIYSKLAAYFVLAFFVLGFYLI